MRILQVHKYLYPKAGAERYVLDIARLLFEHGHTVGLWGTNERFQYPIAPELKGFEIYKDLLVDEIHFDVREGWRSDWQKAQHYIWSTEARDKFRQVLDRFKPDVIHVHNIYHHLTPSILAVARRAGIPVVMTVHDWSLVNPNYTLFDHGAICERSGFSALLHRCIQRSFVATGLAVVSFWVHALMRIHTRAIQAFVVPVPFAVKMLKKARISAKKIHIIPYPLRVHAAKSVHREHGEPYVLYAGRLSAEKGVDLLIRAAVHVPDTRFIIAGSGPEEHALKSLAIAHNVQNVIFTGFLDRATLDTYIARARLIVVPSLWYDVSPYAVLEPQSLGKAVLASHRGGIPDIIHEGKTGFLFHPGDPKVLARKIEHLIAHPRLLDAVGRRAQEQIVNSRDPKHHYHEIMHVYEEVAAR